MKTPVFLKMGLTLIITVIIILSSTQGMCEGTSARHQYKSKINCVSKKTLPAVDLKNTLLSPKGGIPFSTAQKLIANYLKSFIKGDVVFSSEVSEITSKESWEHGKMQLYRVKVGTAWYDGVLIIKNEKVFGSLNGMSLLNIFLADLDNDNIYEVYTTISIGSGIVSSGIYGYNIVTKEGYSMSNRMKEDYVLFVEKSILMGKVLPYERSDSKNAKEGVIKLRKINGHRNIYIDFAQ